MAPLPAAAPALALLCGLATRVGAQPATPSPTDPGATGTSTFVPVDALQGQPTTIPMDQHVFEDLSYRLGTVEDAPAIEFTVQIDEANSPAGVWFGLGIREQKEATDMTGLTIIAGDTDTLQIYDYRVAGGTGAPTRRARTTTELVSVEAAAGVDGANATEFRFYRLYNSGVGYAILDGVPFNLATSRGEGSVVGSWTKHTARQAAQITVDSTAVDPNIFVPVCPYTAVVGGHVYNTLGYQLGLVDKQPAVEFTVLIDAQPALGAGGAWFGMGFRDLAAQRAGSMVGLDIIAGDTTSGAVFSHDPAVGTGAPVRSAGSPTANLSRYADVAGTALKEFKFYRLLDNGVDYTIQSGVAFNLASSIGRGEARPGLWTKHTASTARDITLAVCDELARAVTPPPPREVFTGICPYTDFPAGHVFNTFGYRLGVVGTAPAVELALRVDKGATGSWVGVGFRDANAGPMTGLDIITTDTFGSGVYDYAPAVGIGAPTPSAVTRTELLGVSDVVGNPNLAEIRLLRRLDNGDDDYRIRSNITINVGTAVGAGPVPAGGRLAARHLRSASFDVAFERCAAFEAYDPPAFTPVCPTQQFPAGHVFTSFAYTEGEVGGLPALELTITFDKIQGNAGGDAWFAVGFREAKTGAMTGLDIIAGDTMSQSVTDFDVAQGTGAPVASNTTLSRMTMYRDVPGSTYVEVKFYRMYTNNVDIAIPDATPMSVGTSWGVGGIAPEGAWSKHTNRASIDVTLDACEPMKAIIAAAAAAPSGDGGGGGLADWQIALIVIGSVLCCLLVLGVIFFLMKKKGAAAGDGGDGAGGKDEAQPLNPAGGKGTASAADAREDGDDADGGYRPPQSLGGGGGTASRPTPVSFSDPGGAGSQRHGVRTPQEPQDGDIRQVEASPQRVHPSYTAGGAPVTSSPNPSGITRPVPAAAASPYAAAYPYNAGAASHGPAGSIAQGVPLYISGGGGPQLLASPGGLVGGGVDTSPAPVHPSGGGYPAAVAPPTFSVSPQAYAATPPTTGGAPAGYPSYVAGGAYGNGNGNGNGVHGSAINQMGLGGGGAGSPNPLHRGGGSPGAGSVGGAPLEPAAEAEVTYAYQGCSKASEAREGKELRVRRMEKRVMKRYKKGGFAVVSTNTCGVDAAELRGAQERARGAVERGDAATLSDADVALLFRYRESLSSPFHGLLREAKDASLPLYRVLQCGDDLFEAHVRLPTSHLLYWPAPTLVTPTAPYTPDAAAGPSAPRVVEFEIINARVFEAPDGTLLLPSFSVFVVLSTLLLSPTKCVLRLAHRERQVAGATVSP